jgi:hypothetical protein
MAKKAVITIKGVGEAQRNTLKFLNGLTKDTRILDSIGKDLAFQIQKRTAGRQDEYKQDALTESTVISRDISIRLNGLDVKPKSSNLTLSGQLLSAVRSKSVSASSQIIIFLNAARKKIKKPTKENIKEIAKSKPKKKRSYYYAIGTLMNQSKDENKSNVDIKNDLEKQGRRFLFLSDKLQAMLEAKLREQLSKQLSLYKRVRRRLSL